MEKGEIGIIGLGKMGGNLALQAHEKGYKVIGYDRLPSKELLEKEGIIVAESFEELVKSLSGPRIILLYIPAGSAVDSVVDELVPLLEKGDILVDGGNSYWGDSIERCKRLALQGIHFVDCGTSGGLNGARHGACFMVGGDPNAVEAVIPVLKSMAVKDGVIHAGPPGSGHFVKLVHNGIEFGMLQAIGEGIDLLTHYKDKLDIQGILEVWNHGSVIRSWLIELMAEVYKSENGFSSVPSYIEDTGEVNWLVNDAMRMEVAVPVIAQSVMQLFASRDSEHTWAKAVSMMRHGFGGHPFGENEGIRRERQFGKLENSRDEFLYRKSKNNPSQ